MYASVLVSELRRVEYSQQKSYKTRCAVIQGGGNENMEEKLILLIMYLVCLKCCEKNGKFQIYFTHEWQ